MTMKYFTPERWLRFQDVSNERTFRAAHAEWEEAIAAYRRELSEIGPRLPGPLRRFAESVSLHDATLTAVWRTPGRLALLVRPEAPSDRYVLLTYTLVGEPSVNHSALPPEHQTEQATWLYDEVGVQVTFGAQPPAEDVFVHSILLSNGDEMTILFRRFNVSQPKAIFPDEEQGSRPPEASVSQSA